MKVAGPQKHRQMLLREVIDINEIVQDLSKVMFSVSMTQVKNLAPYIQEGEGAMMTKWDLALGCAERCRILGTQKTRFSPHSRIDFSQYLLNNNIKLKNIKIECSSNQFSIFVSFETL